MVDHSNIPTEVLVRMQNRKRENIQEWGRIYLDHMRGSETARKRVEADRINLAEIEAELWSRKPL